jgi:thymidine phosphorylase
MWRRSAAWWTARAAALCGAARVRLSPADDILIRVERPLDLDSQGQLVASVLSKKVAAGATHVLIDMPVGLTAKVRSDRPLHQLGHELEQVGQALGLQVRVVQTDGVAPVGRGIGPALEARDVLAVLRKERRLPRRPGAARPAAGGTAAGVWRCSGHWARAWPRPAVLARRPLPGRSSRQICEAQGGLRTPPVAAHQQPVLARHSGTVIAIDNRRLARIAKLAGAPVGRLRRASTCTCSPARWLSVASRCLPCTRPRLANWPMRWSTPAPRPRPCM